MPFCQRNAYYLRTSATDVLPLYLYLDERHLGWMSTRILKSVVADLKPLIGPKLEAERYAHYGPGGPANAKRGTVEVHRGDSYQFAYFLRKAEAHPVILKTRNYVMINKGKPPGDIHSSGRQRKRGNGSSPEDPSSTPQISAGRRKRARLSNVQRRKKAAEVIPDSEDEAEESPLSEMSDPDEGNELQAQAPRRSTRKRTDVRRYQEDSDEEAEEAHEDQGQYQEDASVLLPEVKVEEDVNPDAVLHPSPEVPEHQADSALDIDIDEDGEAKSKPSLQLTFRQLLMKDRFLCVVVEPWPALPDSGPTLSTARTTSVPPSERFSRASSVALSSQFGDSSLEREFGQTAMPLFLPSHDERERSATPAPVRFQSVLSTLETMDDSTDIPDNGFGMLRYSQALSSIVGDHSGGLDDDDEMDGSALYGDADEIRTMTL